jgi:hypothetical protein
MSSKNLRLAIIVFAVLTGVIHLFLGVTTSNVVFILNGVGFLGLLWAYLWTPAFLKGMKSMIRPAFIVYTIVTIAAYFASWGLDGFQNIFGVATKAIEVFLVLALLQHKSS